MYASPVMACVAFGANLGDAVATVQHALRSLLQWMGKQNGG